MRIRFVGASQLEIASRGNQLTVRVDIPLSEEKGKASYPDSLPGINSKRNGPTLFLLFSSLFPSFFFLGGDVEILGCRL